MTVTEPQLRQQEVDSHVPELIRRTDANRLSPEWIELAPIFDNPIQDGEEPAVDRIEGLVELAVATSELADKFRDFDGKYLERTNFKSFLSGLNSHLKLYRSLGGIHGIEGRVDSFIILEQGLQRYVEYYEGTETERVGKYSRSIKRLWASVLEEIGEHTGDTTRLIKAMKVNDEIINDETISNVKRYKLHALLARYDIADRFSEKPKVLEALGLDQDITERNAQFYDDIKKYTEDVITEVDEHGLDEARVELELNFGLAEASYVGYVRSLIDERGLSDHVVVRQSFPHQDTSELPAKVYAKLGFKVPRSSYDVIVLDQLTGEKLCIDVKKGKVKGRRIILLNTVRTRIRNNGYTGKEYVEKIGDMASGRAKQLRGLEVTEDEQSAIDIIHDNMDYDDVVARHRRRIGRAILDAA